MRCPNTRTVTRVSGWQKTQQQITVPCGHCPICQANKASAWAGRCAIEQQHARHSFFVTLTYNEDNLPVDDDGFHPVVVRDLQLFYKKLRKKIAIRHFTVGEYGDENFRPHYHAMIFTNEKKSFNDFYFLILDTWANGNIDFKTLDSKSINYVLRYFLHKNKAIDELFTFKKKTKPFAIMSRRPAIGSQLCDQPDRLAAMLQDGYINLGKKFLIHEYYKRKYQLFDPLSFDQITKRKMYERMRQHFINHHSGTATLRVIAEEKRQQGILLNLHSRSLMR